MLRDEPLEPLQPAAMKDSDALSDVETAIDGDEWLPEPSVARPPVTQATATRNIDAAVAEWWSINDKEVNIHACFMEIQYIIVLINLMHYRNSNRLFKISRQISTMFKC